jgi:hypothetical protein
MEHLKEKIHFLKSDYIPSLATIAPDAPRLWGKMNVQQMVEHMADYMRLANGKTKLPIAVDEAMIPRMQAFLATEKPMRENTPNSLLPDEPTAVKNDTLAAAIAELEQEVKDFFIAYEQEPTLQLIHPFFGVLGYELQVQLLYKHCTHHLRQFGITIAAF